MGIKKLFTFLNNRKLYKLYSYLNELIDDLDLKKSTIIVGVDGNLYLYKYTYSYGNMLFGFYNQIVKFLSIGIIPFYIFELNNLFIFITSGLSVDANLVNRVFICSSSLNRALYSCCILFLPIRPKA